MSDQMQRLKTALQDRYRVEREIGAGGMAIVYLAHDLKHDRRVAIKVLRPELAAALADTDDDARALAVMELIYAQGKLTESAELLNLAKMYLGQAVPIKTVRLIEKELASKRIERNADSLLVLADALLLAIRRC